MFKDLNKNTKTYLVILYVFTILLLVFSFKKYSSSVNASIFDIAFFSILSILNESLLVEINDVAISTAFAVTLSSLLLFNPLVTVIIISVGMAFRIWKNETKVHHVFNTPLYKTLFNVCVIDISLILSSQIFELIGGKYINFNTDKVIIPIFIMTIVFLMINYLIISLLLYFWVKANFLASIFENFRMGLLNILGMVPFGIIVAYVFKTYNYIGVIVIFGPILLARYSFVMYSSMKKSYVDTVKALSLAIEAKDRYTEGHSERVADYVEKIARKMKFSEPHIEDLKIASLLHDIGKIGIPEIILNKPGKLNNQEYSVIKEHPVIGANIVKDVEFLKKSVYIIKCHHERYDGKGYPMGLKGNEIPFDAYIIAIADALDAMCSNRPYRSAMTKGQAVSIIQNEKGKQFHPEVAEVLLKILESEEI